MTVHEIKKDLQLKKDLLEFYEKFIHMLILRGLIGLIGP